MSLSCFEGDKLNIAIGSMTVGATVKAVDIPIVMGDGSVDEEFSSKKSRQGTARLALQYPVCYDLWTNLLLTKELLYTIYLFGTGQNCTKTVLHQG